MIQIKNASPSLMVIEIQAHFFVKYFLYLILSCHKFDRTSFFITNVFDMFSNARHPKSRKSSSSNEFIMTHNFVSF